MRNVAEFTINEGYTSWRNSAGQLHRDDFSPARVYTNGKEEYYYYDLLYYVVYPDGIKHIVNTFLFNRMTQNCKPVAA